MFRRLTTNDRVAFRALRQSALESNPQAYATSDEDWRNAPDEKIDALLDGNGGVHPVFGVFADAEETLLIGLVGLRRELRPTTRHKATVWGLYVSPERRREGVGSTLLAGLLEAAKELPDLEMVRLVVATEDAEAVRLFERSGFQLYGTEPRARRVGERYFDQAFYYRVL
jgi:ribosomal protein S18 acetylase RimI-like enzyme